MKVVFVEIETAKDGSLCWTIYGSKGRLIGGGGTRRRMPPKDPIHTACKMVENAIKRACLPGRPNPK